MQVVLHAAGNQQLAINVLRNPMQIRKQIIPPTRIHPRLTILG
jgi:hypothetical protein